MGQWRTARDGPAQPASSWSPTCRPVCSQVALGVGRVCVIGAARCAEGVRPRIAGQHEGKGAVQVGRFGLGRHTGTPPHWSWREVRIMGGGGGLKFRAATKIPTRMIERTCSGPSADGKIEYAILAVAPASSGASGRLGKAPATRTDARGEVMPWKWTAGHDGQGHARPVELTLSRSAPLRSLATLSAARYSLAGPSGTRCSSLGREWAPSLDRVWSIRTG